LRIWRGETISRAAWVAALLLLLGLFAALSHLSATTIDYSRYNPEWNGTSRLFQLMDDHGAIMVTRPVDLPASGDAILLLLVPDGEFDQDEISRLRRFMGEGNILVLVSDREAENLLLSGLGSGIRVHDANLSSVDRSYDHPSSVLGFSAGDDPLVAGISRILLNSPSYLEGGVPVFETSLLSWIDADGDSRLSKEETLQRYRVVATEQHGEGILYVIADPSIFINGMLTPRSGDGNSVFIQHILTAKPLLLVEQGHSRTASAPAVIRVVNLVKESTITKMALITLIFLAVSLFILQRRKEP
jgi:hypothetical protein